MTTAAENRMTNNGQTGMPSGINTTVSSIIAWHVTRKIKANTISFRDTPSSCTAWIITPARKAKPIVKPVTNVNDVFSFIPKNLVKGAKAFDKVVSQPCSRINCSTIISGKIIAANWRTAMIAVFNPCRKIADQVVNAISDAAIKPYCAGSDPPGQSKLMKKADINANEIRMPDINHQFTPTLE